MKDFLLKLLSLLVLPFYLSAYNTAQEKYTCPTPSYIKCEYQKEKVKITWRRNIGHSQYFMIYYTCDRDKQRMKIIDTSCTTSFPYTVGVVTFKLKAVCKDSCFSNSEFTRWFQTKI